MTAELTGSPLDGMGNRAPQQVRSADRRERLIAVAAHLLWSKGIGAVSHRTVARAAGVPLGSTTYYFRSLATLVAAAVEHLEIERIAHADAALAAADGRTLSARKAAELTAACHLGDRLSDAEVISRYEVYVTGARYAEVRRLLARGRARMLAQTEAAMTTMRRPLLCTAPQVAQVLDGSVLEGIIEGTPNIAETAIGDVASLLNRT